MLAEGTSSSRQHCKNASFRFITSSGTTLSPFVNECRENPQIHPANAKTAQKTKGAFFYPQFWNKNGWHGMLGIIRIVCIKKPPSVLAEQTLRNKYSGRRRGCHFSRYRSNFPLTFSTMHLEAMFHFVQRCNLSFSPVETYLNPQRSSRRPPSWIFIRNILFILPLGAE